MDFSFEFSGGRGKHIMFTSLIKWVNEKFPDSKITVISPYPDVFEYNPRIYRNLPITQSYLFEDYIQGKDYRKGDPYLLEEYYRDKNKMHFSEICPKAFGFNEYNVNPHNEIFLTKGERTEFLEIENKKVVTFQPFGGIPLGNISVRDKLDSNERDIPFEMATRIASILKSKGYEIMQLRRPNDPAIPGATQLEMPIRNFISLGIHCKFHIGIDGCFMHAMAAFEKPQLIFWGNTHLDNLGYKYQGMINSFKTGSMSCNPHVSMPDRNAIYPHVDQDKESYWVYTDSELEALIGKMIGEK